MKTTTGVALALMLCATGANAQAIFTERNISVEAAFKISQAAIAACKANGYDISVVVVDRNGLVRLAVRADSASPHNFELARRKAYTARTFRRTSGCPSTRARIRSARSASAARRDRTRTRPAPPQASPP